MKAKTYQIKIQLEGVKPPIWRRVLVSSDMTLARFHDVIQISMGWLNVHLHSFERDGELYGPSIENAFQAMYSELIPLSTLLRTEKESIRYEYDFGDGWSHEITLEKTRPLDLKISLPVCMDGAGSCPPEDCGGPHRYMYLLEVLTDPTHDEYRELSEWVGDSFPPEDFDLAQTNDIMTETFS